MGSESKNMNIKVISPNVEYTDDFIASKYKYSISDVKIENNEYQVSGWTIFITILNKCVGKLESNQFQKFLFKGYNWECSRKHHF